MNYTIAPERWYRARLDRVIDGDTAVMTLDLGFSVATSQHIRIEGLKAPEKGHPDWARAKEAAEAWFERYAWPVPSAAQSRWPYLVRTREVKTFERYVGGVFSSDGHSILADLMNDFPGVFTIRQEEYKRLVKGGKWGRAFTPADSAVVFE